MTPEERETIHRAALLSKASDIVAIAARIDPDHDAIRQACVSAINAWLALAEPVEDR